MHAHDDHMTLISTLGLLSQVTAKHNSGPSSVTNSGDYKYRVIPTIFLLDKQEEFHSQNL